MSGIDPPSGDLPAFLGIDTSKANIARVYDAFLGGKDNYEADRKVHRQILQITPDADRVAQEHRQWLVRAVRYLAEVAKIDQFLDCGSGLPTAENTHQVAQRFNPDARVVYVDNDPIVVVHGRALLAVNELTHFAAADLTKPAEVLHDPVVTANLDLGRPLALIQCATLHHVEDDQNPRQIMASYIDALPSGSYVALAHWYDAADGSAHSKLARNIQETFRGSSMASTRVRTREEIASLLDGLELVEPGLVFPHDWRPDGPRVAPLVDLNFTVLSAVGRKP